MPCPRGLMLLFLGTTLLAASSAQAISPQSEQRAEDIINVHLVPHTHDDVGWLKTVDEYFYGANNSIQHAGVQYILDSVITSLTQNPDRKFIYVEQAFFNRWWLEQSSDMQEVVKKLVANGQLSFINGGWCMNDEASTHYLAIIDQMTLGHSFLRDTFNVTPNIGWQIDPFGHSAEYSALIAEMGFDGLFFARIDYQDRTARLASRNMEMIWRGSPSYGSDSDIFTGVLYSGYGPPSGFCWDQSCSDPPIQDDRRLFNYNVDDVVNRFVEAAQDQQKFYKSNHIMMTMGSDFQYENANLWFKNLDKLIKYVNADGRVKAFYSTPYAYVAAKNAANETWALKTDDFFPYADQPHAMWTGYFTSRPALKGYVRDMSTYLQTVRFFETFNLLPFPESGVAPSFRLAEALGVAQHHDAVSGTEKQHVAYDYAERLALGADQASSFLTQAVDAATGASGHVECPRLNVSICDASTSGTAFSVTVWNPSVQSRSMPIRIPISNSNVTVSVVGSNVSVLAQVVPLSNTTAITARDDPETTATHELSFISWAHPAWSWVTFEVRPVTSPADTRTAAVLVPPRRVNLGNGVTTISNEAYQVSFDEFGKLANLTDRKTSATMSLNQDWFWYEGSVGNDVSPQASGAYIFRPNATTPNQVASGVSFSVVEGPVFSAVYQEFAPWITQQVRVYQTQGNEGSMRFVENEFLVGPIPIEDGKGKEIITRYNTDSASDVFYTDANGREMLQRKINYRPTWNYTVNEPVAGNYFPINTAMYLDGVSTSADHRLTILTDRSQGGGMVTAGVPELMVHRRLLKDDSRGVGEPLNEPGLNGKGLIIRAQHTLLFDPSSDAAFNHRMTARDITYKPRLFFLPGSGTVKATGSFAPGDWPANVDIVTWQYLDATTRLLRIAHLFPPGEDPKWSTPVTITDLDKWGVTALEEMNLSNNQPKSAIKRMQWNTASGTGVAQSPDSDQPTGAAALDITIQPGRIVTYRATVSSSNRLDRHHDQVRHRVVRNKIVQK